MITFDNFKKETISGVEYLELDKPFLGGLTFVTIEPKAFGGYYLNSNRFCLQCETIEECINTLNNQLCLLKTQNNT